VPEAGPITAAEESLASRLHDEEIGTDEFVAEIDHPEAGDGVRTASLATPGGTVSAHVRLEGERGEWLREVLFTGDFFIAPPRTLFDLESALRGALAADAASVVESFFAGARIGLLSVAPADFARAIDAAVSGIGEVAADAPGALARP